MNMLALVLALAALGQNAPAPAVPAAPAHQKSMLIFGGTSFIGPSLVPVALERGWKVTLFNRGKTNADLFPEVEKLRGDRDPNVGDGLKALEGRKFDAIIDDSGHVTRHVKASCAALADEHAFAVFVSSLSAYASHDAVGVDEDQPLAPLLAPSEDFMGEAFGPLKALCEKEYQDAFPGRAAIVRPGLIVGNRDRSGRFGYWVGRMAKGGDVLAPGDGNDPIMIIDVRDLAEFLVTLCDHRTAGVFNAIGPDKPYTMKEIVETCAKAAEVESKITWVDGAFLEEHGVHGWTDLPVWMPQTEGLRGFHLRKNQRAIDAGLKFRPLLDTCKDALEYWRSLPEDKRTRPGRGLTPEREAELLKEWRAR